MKCSCKRLWVIVAGLIVVLLLGVIFLAAQYWVWLGKIHEVSPGKVYRSAQLSMPQLSQGISAYKIQAILNLRKNGVGQTHYQEELKLATAKNIAYYSVPMDSYTTPSKTQLLQLVNILQTSPKPLLIHCEGGVDRAGLASAIYLIIDNQSLAAAQKQLSLHYYVIYKSSVGKLVIPFYAEWLKKNNLPSSRQNFMKWLDQP